LNFDLLAAAAQKANDCVAQNGVSQVSDVSGLVRVYRSVLDDYLASEPRLQLRRIGQRPRNVFGAIEKDVYISRAGRFDSGHTWKVVEFARQPGGNIPGVLFLAGCGFQSFCELECDWERKVAHRSARRRLEHNVRKLDIEELFDRCDKPVAN
jgi:hypothetical protein